MATYIKDSTDYGIYIVESEAGNDDWVTDHDDMKEADIDSFTEGTDYIYLPYANNIQLLSEYKVKVIDFFEGAASKVGIGEGHFVYKATGRFQGASESARDTKIANILEFFKRHMSVSGNDIYIGHRKVGENWRQFPDDSYNHKGYLKGVFSRPKISHQAFNRYFEWEIIFREAW